MDTHTDGYSDSLRVRPVIRSAVLVENTISGELAAARIAFSGGAGKGLSLERHYAAADDGHSRTR